jgi:signal transduction histidine kinase
VVDDITEMGTLEQRLAQNRNELRLLRDRLTRQNRELDAAIAELRRLSEMKSMFVSVAAHELRTPLASISGFVELLLDERTGSLTDIQREFLEIVQSSASHLIAISNNLLDATQLELGQIELVLQPVNLPALVKTAVAEFRPQLEAKAQRLTLQFSQNLPLVLCDQTRVAQIIANLLSNASKYTPEGGSIMVSLAPADQPFVQLSVADNGVGIPAEDQARLFDRFFRAKTGHLTEASGTGLGLYITRSLVELHGGRIWFESEPEQGSTFYVTFPVAEAPVISQP